MTARLFVGNLSFSLTDEALRDAFLAIDLVERAEIVRDRYDGRSRGFGFVEMASPAESELVVQELNAKELMGRPMPVEAATSRRATAPNRFAAHA